MAENVDKSFVIPLALLNEGETGRIKSISDLEPVNLDKSSGCKGWCFRHRKRKGPCSLVKSMGLRPGQEVEVKQNQPGQPILVKVEQSLIAISRGIAMKIIVSKKS